MRGKNRIGRKKKGKIMKKNFATVCIHGRKINTVQAVWIYGIHQPVRFKLITGPRWIGAGRCAAQTETVHMKEGSA